jgi:methyl-accepting chemotaxis protein
MNQWKIGTRIRAGFGALLLVLIGVVGIGFYKAKQIETDSNSIAQESLPGLSQAAMIQYIAAERFALMNQHINSDDKGIKLSIESRLAELNTKIEEVFVQYERRHLNPEEKDGLAAVRASRALYAQGMAKVLDLSRKMKSQDATKVYSEEVQPLFAKYQQTISNLITVNRKYADASAETIQASTKAMVMALLFGGFLGLAIGLVIAVVVTRSITEPLARTLGFVEVVSKGDLTTNIVVESRDELGNLQTAMNEMLANLRRTLGEVAVAADNVASGSQELSGSAQVLSEGASEQSSAAEESTASMEEMASSIQQNADNARQTDKIATKAAEDTRESGDAVNRTMEAMKEISSKINIIEEIARKTDLLALNAAVEAARAGEHGKGFAVVASEVRKLAERSQLAAAEISTLTVEGVRLAEGAGAMLNRLVPDIRKTAELVREIAASCNEQSVGAAQVNKAMQQLDQVIQQNASASEEIASTSEELSSQAANLQEVIGFFKLDQRSPERSRGMRSATRSSGNRTVRKTSSQQLSRLNQAVKSEGVGIDLDMARSGGDAQDREFEAY